MIAAGGEARALFLVWRYSGRDPWQVYNDLDANGVPLYLAEDEEPVPLRPRHPHRVKCFLYACAQAAEAMEIKLAGGKIT